MTRIIKAEFKDVFNNGESLEFMLMVTFDDLLPPIPISLFADVRAETRGVYRVTYQYASTGGMSDADRYQLEQHCSIEKIIWRMSKLDRRELLRKTGLFRSQLIRKYQPHKIHNNPING